MTVRLSPLRALCALALSWLIWLMAVPAGAAPNGAEYRLGPGDAIRVQVFQNPDLSVEARVSEAGAISYPLVGSVQVGGLSLGEAERRIADALRQGRYLKSPQVNINLLQVRDGKAQAQTEAARAAIENDVAALVVAGLPAADTTAAEKTWARGVLLDARDRFRAVRDA